MSHQRRRRKTKKKTSFSVTRTKALGTSRQASQLSEVDSSTCHHSQIHLPLDRTRQGVSSMVGRTPSRLQAPSERRQGQGGQVGDGQVPCRVGGRHV